MNTPLTVPTHTHTHTSYHYSVHNYRPSLSAVTVAISECAPTVTASGTVPYLSCVLRLPVTTNKTTHRLSDHCPDVSVCHVNISQTSHCTPHCSSQVSPNKMHNCSYCSYCSYSFPHSWCLYFAVSYFIEWNMKFLLALKSPTD